jgi:hypothetical protein
MKNSILLFFLLFGSLSFSQVYGEIFMEKRPITKDIDYTLYYSREGVIVFDIAVNNDGDVTSCNINKGKSTIKSTPMMMKAKNRIMQELKFEKGGQYPKFHRGFVQIKLRPATEDLEE